MLEARADALQQAVEAGTITSEQAEWMSQRMSRMEERGFGSGGFGSGAEAAHVMVPALTVLASVAVECAALEYGEFAPPPRARKSLSMKSHRNPALIFEAGFLPFL
jgi:hypothetical protein